MEPALRLLAWSGLIVAAAVCTALTFAFVFGS
jgi:hypothetical protein